MKILIVSVHFSTGSGIENVVVETATTLHLLGHLVEVWAVSDKEGKSIGGVNSIGCAPTQKLQRFIFFHYLWKKNLVSQLKMHYLHYDCIIVTHVNYLQPVIEFTKRYCKKKIPVIVWVYGIDVWGAYGKRFLPYLREADRIWSISKYTTNQLMGNIEDEKIALVNLSVNVEEFCPDARIKKKDELLIVGRMDKNERYKGHDILIEVISKLHLHGITNLSMRIVGDGNDRYRLEEKVKKLGVSELVVFSGRITKEELINAYRQALIFIMPSFVQESQFSLWKGEGLGIVYLEAQSCGTPVIASAHGGSPETVNDGVTGLIVDPLNTIQIIDAIKRLYGNRQLLDSMGIEARKWVLNHFTPDIFKERVNTLLKKEF